MSRPTKMQMPTMRICLRPYMSPSLPQMGTITVEESR